MRWALWGLTTCLAAGLTSRQAWAWGEVGHRAASMLAERRLTPSAKSAIRELLNPGETLADASLWADAHRKDLEGSAPWHYVNVPLTTATYEAKYCRDGGCVVSKVDELRKLLARPNVPLTERQQALRLLVHLIEDLHQPMHVGDRGNRGGNDLEVRFFDHTTNLHRLWDEGIIERHTRSVDGWLGELEALATPDATAKWSRDDTAAWATESLEAARIAYLIEPLGVTPLDQGANLGDTYYAAALPLARRRLSQAGVRLAWVLNDIFR